LEPRAAGVFLGGGITWWTSRYYYQRAGWDLRAEAADLRRLVTMFLLAAENAGFVKLTKDGHGNVTSYAFVIHAAGGIPSAEAFGHPTVLQKPKST